MTPEWKFFVATMVAGMAAMWVLDRLDAKYGITAAQQRGWRLILRTLWAWLRR